jgi:hypothetical protein
MVPKSHFLQPLLPPCPLKVREGGYLFRENHESCTTGLRKTVFEVLWSPFISSIVAMCLKKRLKAKPGPKVLTINICTFKGTAQNLARARYVLAFLQTSNRVYAATASGLSRHAHERIIKGLAQNGHLGENERSGRPPLYTEDNLEAAYQLLSNQKYGKLTGVDLLRQLKANGKMHATAEPKRFMQHLGAFILKKGHRLITNCTKTTFFISDHDAQARVEYAKWWLAKLDTVPLTCLVFVDEITLEESPHPKGKLTPARGGGG